MSERVPEGWSVSNLGKQIDILSGFPFKSSEFTNDPSDFGLIRIRDLLGQKLETFFAGEYSTDFIVKIGDILIGMDGDFHIVQWKSQNALLNQRICKLVPKKGGFDINFVHYFLIPALKKIHNQTTATTVKHLSVKDIREVEQAFPPLPEQKKIASILTSVDGVIEKTQLQIDKLQDLKKATMNELLTKGIGHTEFKDSELGSIPKSWEVKKFDAITTSITCGVAATPEYVDAEVGVPFLSAQNVQKETVVLNNFKYISPEFHKKLTKNTKPEIGDILYSRVGAGFGEAAVVNFEWEFSVYVSLTLIKLSGGFSNQFYKYFLNSRFGKDQAKEGVFAGGGVPNLNVGVVKEFDILVPSKNEQEEISSVLVSLDENIYLQKNKLFQTQDLKKSLMQDLLTGKVRVQVN